MSLRNFPTLVCHGCGCAFQPRNGKKTQRFCSKSCGALHRDNSNNHGNSTSFKPGNPTWNKGLVGYLSGRKHTEETKDKIREANSGERSPNWKGGISEENYRIRRTARYRDWREAVFTRDNWTCQECGDRSTAGHRIRIHADHIKPFASYPDLRFDVDNGRTLCEPCHRKTPTWGFTGQTATLAVAAMAAD